MYYLYLSVSLIYSFLSLLVPIIRFHLESFLFDARNGIPPIQIKLQNVSSNYQQTSRHTHCTATIFQYSQHSRGNFSAVVESACRDNWKQVDHDYYGSGQWQAMQVETWLWEHKCNKKLCFRRNGTIKRHVLIPVPIKTETVRYSNPVHNFTTQSTEFCSEIISFQELGFPSGKKLTVNHVKYPT